MEIDSKKSYGTAHGKASRIPPSLLAVMMAAVGGYAPAPARADVRSPVKIRMPRETTQPAKTGEAYSGVLELIVPKDGVIESVEIGGEGWQALSVGLRAATPAALGETIHVPFQAEVLDASKKLEVRISFDGSVTYQRFDLRPERLALIGRDRPSMRVGAVERMVPADEGEAEGGDAGPRGCEDQIIRVRGRIAYVRPDAQVIGADNIKFQIMDEDDLDSEVMHEGYTDEQGSFDVTLCWDDCDPTCEDPDVYLRYECSTGVAIVQNDDFGSDVYAWSSIDTLIFNDYAGHDLDFGVLGPTDTGMFPVLQMHNSVVRAHRYVAENSGYISEQIVVVWEDEPGAYYSPHPDDEVHIGPDEEWNEGTHVHEWGHHLLYEWTAPLDPDYCNGFCDSDPASPGCGMDACVDGGHCGWCNETDHDAWNEGFPDWLASVLLRIWQARYGGPSAPQPMSINDGRWMLETVQNCCPGDTDSHSALLTEGFVAALLQDIDDPPQDPGQTGCPQDSMALGGDEVLAVVREYRPIRVTEFIAGFRAEYPQFDHDFRSTARAIASEYVPAGWLSTPLQVFASSGCGTYRTGETITLTIQTNASRYSTCMQWQHDGVNVTDGGRISGATTDALTITNAVAADAGSYTLRITSCDGFLPNQCNGTQTTTSPPIRVPIISSNQPAHRVTGWGSNNEGALGRGTTTPGSDVNPADVINLNNAVAVSAGYWNSFAVLSDGTVWGWGTRYLGNGTSNPSATPVQVNGLSDIVAISASGQWTTAMALDANGHVWTWGSNFYNQLGYSQPNGVALNPGQVNLDCVIDISMGVNHAAAVTSDGSLWAWGSNTFGELGQGTTVASNTPVRVTDLSNIVEVECGYGHTLARRADGTVWACGNNGNGQLGDGTTTNRNRFVQVGGLANVTQISAGTFHSLAVCADSTPWAWGQNGNLQLGTGSPNGSNPTPAPLLNLPAVRALDGGNNSSVFVASDGTIFTCGYNGNGQLGRPTGVNGEGVPRPVDTRVGAAVQVSAGGSFMMVISPGARITAPVPDQLAAGCATARFTVATAGEPPLSYQWGRNVGGLFVELAEAGRFSGTTTPTLTISETDPLDSNPYQVRVRNPTNEVYSNRLTLVTPPPLNTFDTPQNAADWWTNDRGNWAVTNGAYAAGAPDDNPATYSSFKSWATNLPIELTDFSVELDVVNASFTNFTHNGGIWVRSRLTPNYPDAALLGFGDLWPWNTGDLFWQRWHEPGSQSAQNTAEDVYDAGETIHLRVEVRGNTYTAYLNDSPTPTTTMTTTEYPTGRIALFDNAAAGTAFDNVFIQTLTSCTPGSGDEPVRIIQRPQSQTVPSGAQVNLSVVASGTEPLSYQWLRNGFCIEGTSPSYSFTAMAAIARYECTVTNACGSVGSYPAVITVEGAGVPAATLTTAVTRKANAAGPGGFCDLPLIPGVQSEPRQGGITELHLTFDVPPGGPGANPVTIEQAICAAPAYAPYAGALALAAAVAGNGLVLTFTPGLENGRTYRLNLGSDVTSIAGQFVEVSGLVGDVNSDGRANGSDRSAVVAQWTGPNHFSCDTDLDGNGRTHSPDRSIVVGAWTGAQNCAP